MGVKYTDTSSMLGSYIRSGTVVKYMDTANTLIPYLRKTDTSYMLSNYLRSNLGVKYADTSSMFGPYLRNVSGVKYTDTSGMLSGYARSGSLLNYLPLTGGTVSGSTIFNGNLSAPNATFTNLSAYQLWGNPSIAVYDGSGAGAGLNTYYLEIGNDGTSPNGSGYHSKTMIGQGVIRYANYNGGSVPGVYTNSVDLLFPSTTVNKTLKLPNASGTLALVNDTSSGYLQKSGGTLTGSLTIDSISALSTTGTTFLTHTNGLIQSRTAAQVLSDIGAAPANGGGYLPISGGNITGNLGAASLSVNGLATATNISATGSQTIGGTLSTSKLVVSGIASLASLSVTGNETVGGSLSAASFSTSGTAATGALSVTGNQTVSGLATTASLSVTGNQTVGGTLAVTGKATLSTLSVTGNGTVGGTLQVTGVLTAASFSGVATNLSGTAASLISGKASTLTTSRTIQGVPFDGSANITPFSGTGFVKLNGATVSYDNSTYLTTTSAASIYALSSSIIDTSSISIRINGKVNITDTAAMLSGYLRTGSVVSGVTKYSDTALMLTNYLRNGWGVKYSDTSSMLSGYAKSGQLANYLPITGGTITGTTNFIGGSLLANNPTFVNPSAYQLWGNPHMDVYDGSGAGTFLSTHYLEVINDATYPNGSYHSKTMIGQGVIRYANYSGANSIGNYTNSVDLIFPTTITGQKITLPNSTGTLALINDTSSGYIRKADTSAMLSGYIRSAAISGFASSSSISGTTNYIPKFNSGNSIFNSLIYDNGISVGIGTSNPQSLFSVNGEITATKLTVTSGGWSDYVFNKTYKLRPLNELESYINANKHLPDMPSAREVAEKGINVGENQAALLRKIEELTLYVIEQKKQIDLLMAEREQRLKKGKNK